MIRAVLFDLGNTLVGYYTRAQWPAVWKQSLANVRDELADRELLTIRDAEIPERVERQRGESEDLRITPLASRLGGIFDLAPEQLEQGRLGEAICRAFLAPAWQGARVVDGATAILDDLRARGYVTAVLSNTPWGSPGDLWREHVASLGLAGKVDLLAFCTDAGYRKPHRAAFEYVLERLELSPDQCLFIGDDPRWDVAGPQAIGMHAAVIRHSHLYDPADAALADTLDAPVITGFDEIFPLIDRINASG